MATVLELRQSMATIEKRLRILGQIAANAAEDINADDRQGMCRPSLTIEAAARLNDNLREIADAAQTAYELAREIGIQHC